MSVAAAVVVVVFVVIIIIINTTTTNFRIIRVACSNIQRRETGRLKSVFLKVQILVTPLQPGRSRCIFRASEKPTVCLPSEGK
jgi:hypothetical protein